VLRETHFCPALTRHLIPRADYARPHPATPTRRPYLPCPGMPLTHARRLLSPPSIHTKTPSIAALPLHATNPCALKALELTPPHQRAAHLCPAPARHQPLRADWAHPHPSTQRRRSSLPRPCTPHTVRRRLRSPPPLQANATPIYALRLYDTNPCAPTALVPLHPHKGPAQRCPAPVPHQPLRADCARPKLSTPTRSPFLPCPCTPPTLARRLGSPPSPHTKTPPIAAPPLRGTNPCAPAPLSSTPQHHRAGHLYPAPV